MYRLLALLIVRSIGRDVVVQKEKYQMNVCGEGGEYETFTLNCPLFKKRIAMSVKAYEVVR
jgi:diphthine-ammonia ligase